MFWLRNKKIKFSLHTLNFHYILLTKGLFISHDLVGGLEPNFMDITLEHDEDLMSV